MKFTRNNIFKKKKNKIKRKEKTYIREKRKQANTTATIKQRQSF